MAQRQKTYSAYTILAFIAVAWPALLGFIKYTKRDGKDDTTYNKPNLTGLVISNEKPKFSAANWFSGSYQAETDDYDNDHWALKESMVRLNNQFYYAAFNQIRVNGFVMGKEDYLFSESYIFSAFGDDLVPEEKVISLLQKAKVVQDTLHKKGIDLLLVYAPGKGSYCKELVEDKYVHPVKNTNLDLFVSNSRKLGLNYLDLATEFENRKTNTPHPLFPKFGHHWSNYGECIAVQKIIASIENLHHCRLPHLTWDTVIVTDTARSRDADVLKSMNLYTDPPQNMKLAYPEAMFTDSLLDTTRVLTISDSYWYGPVYMGIGNACFGKGQFWYYYNRVVPSPKPGEKVEVWELDLKKEIESNGVIMLLYSDGNLPGFGNNFITDAYELYTSPATYQARNEKNRQIQQYAKQVRESPVLLKKSTQKSKDLQIPLDSAIRLDAIKMAGFTK
jgi:hypothetical protein